MDKLTFFLVIISAIFCVTWGAESQITKAMKKFKIIPEIVSADIDQTLKVTFDSGASVNKGNEISPFEARNQPALDWDANDNACYTILCMDVDAPAPDDRSISNIVTWMVGNILGKDVDSGEVLVEYIPVSPPRGSQLHRSIYLVFEHPKKIKFDRKPIDASTITGRPYFSLDDFSEKYGFGGPVAGNFYLTQFDDHVLKVYKRLSCCFELNKPE
ncbi:protein D3-like [Eupeodes corollae]|uniref:protein D3-like n=1 Tax=Eupeodes corollae TaxID=290404 RepID=UPI002491695A|nr:protein D3-like [Eupeodes corollae]